MDMAFASIDLETVKHRFFFETHHLFSEIQATIRISAVDFHVLTEELLVYLILLLTKFQGKWNRKVDMRCHGQLKEFTKYG